MCLELTHPTAQKACIAGSFNDWHPSVTPMIRLSDETMAKTKRIIFCGAIAGLLLVLSGCASTSERGSTQSLNAEDTARSHEQVGGATSSRKQLPELNDASGPNDYLAYAALEMVSQGRTLPDPEFNYGYFIQEVETRVGPQEQRVGLSQMFPWFGKSRLRGEAALEGANAMQQQYEAAKLRLFDEVKQAYYELYYVGHAVGIVAYDETKLVNVNDGSEIHREGLFLIK